MPALQLTAAEFTAESGLNVVGALYCVQFIAPGMFAAGNGSIIFTGGGLTLHPQYGVGVSALSAGKSALRASAAASPVLGRASVLLLAGCNVVVGSGAMRVTGLLGPIGNELRVDTAAAGQLLIVYAVSFAVGAPVVAVLAGRV